MNLNISGHHLEVTPAIRDYVTSKLSRALSRFDSVIDAQVILSVEKLRHKAEVTVRVPGKDLHSEAAEETLYAAIDLLADKLDRQVTDHKNRVRDHAHESAKRQVIE